jgi:Uma2 family endonuclease
MNVNTPAQPSSGTMDVDEFMAFLETRPDNERWDLIEGVAVMMAPPSYAHQRITRNFCELLYSAFSEQRLDLFAYFSAGVRNPGLRNSNPSRTWWSCLGAGNDLYSENFGLAG